MAKSMKNRNIIVFFLGVILLLTACERDLDTWSGTDSVYFDMRTKNTISSWGKYRDTTAYSFLLAAMDQQDTILRIKVNVQGDMVGFDRPLSFEISDSTTAIEGEDFKIENLNVTVPADSTHTYIEVRLIRSEALKKENRFIEFRLLQNEYFNLNWQVADPTADEPVSMVTHRIIYGDLITAWPSDWMNSYFGTFSRTKMDFICETMGIEPRMMLDMNYMSIGRVQYIVQTVQIELDRRMAMGDPMLDENDEPMTLNKK